MEIVTIQQLDNICLAAVSMIYKYNNNLKDFARLQFEYGLRVNEMFELSNFTHKPNGTIQLYMNKTDETRILNNIEFNKSINWYTYNDLVNSRYVTLNKYTRAFNKSISYKGLKVGDKNISTHLFRHNRTKQLYLQYGNIQDVAVIFGTVDLPNVQGYVDSIVYY